MILLHFAEFSIWHVLADILSPVSMYVQNYWLPKSQSRQPWYEPMPRDWWKVSAARKNVITVLVPYIFINAAKIGIGGHALSFLGTHKCNPLDLVWCTMGNLSSLCVQAQPINFPELSVLEHFPCFVYQPVSITTGSWCMGWYSNVAYYLASVHWHRQLVYWKRKRDPVLCWGCKGWERERTQESLGSCNFIVEWKEWENIQRGWGLGEIVFFFLHLCLCTFAGV